MAARADSPPIFQRSLPLTLAILALGLLLFALEFIRPGYFLHDDNATWFAGAYLHDYRVLTETGRPAVINFYQYGGEPFLEQGQTGVLYPPVYLGEFLAKVVGNDPRQAIAWILSLHLLFGLAGFYFWLRHHRVACRIAALMGLAWALQPFVMIVAASWVVVTYVAAWLPWLFWAFDRLIARPSTLRATLLGTVLGLFFLQGYVQWVVYSLCFLALYALYQIILNRDLPKLRLLGHLLFAALVFVAWSAPLLLPMLHAVDLSAARAQTVDLSVMLYYRVRSELLWPAQIGLFRPFMFGLSSAIFFCPALVLMAIPLVRFFQVQKEVRRGLFVFLLLGVLALIFSGRWYFLLSGVPLLDKFRWPFKVFVFADFFLLGALAVALSPGTTGSRRAPVNPIALVCAVLVMLVETTVSLSQHDGNFFSKTVLPTAAPSLPCGMDLHLGRVIAIDDHLPEATCSGFFTHAYGTFYEVPSIGGYNPLVGRETLRFGFGLDFPNVYFAPPQKITPEIRNAWALRGVRYWIVDPHAAQLPDFAKFDGLKLLASEPDRLIYEDTRALSPVHSLVNSGVACPLIYSGNSLLVSLQGAASPVTVSVGPGDGWWYRLDGGPWLKADYHHEGLILDFPAATRRLEVSYFDPRFEEGLLVSGALLVILILAFFGVMRRAP